MLAPLPHHGHASPTSTNQPHTSLHPTKTQRPSGAPTAFVNGTAYTPIRSHLITHTRTPPFHHHPALTYPQTPQTQRTPPYRTPTTTTYASSRRLTNNHHPNSANLPRSPASEGTIVRHQHRPQDQHSRPSSNQTGKPRPPHSTICPQPVLTTTTPPPTQPIPHFTNHLAHQQLPPATNSSPFYLTGPTRSLARTYPHRALTTSTATHGAKHARPSSATTT
jgi:hypothetical protein